METRDWNYPSPTGPRDWIERNSQNQWGSYYGGKPYKKHGNRRPRSHHGNWHNNDLCSEECEGKSSVRTYYPSSPTRCEFSPAKRPYRAHSVTPNITVRLPRAYSPLAKRGHSVEKTRQKAKPSATITREADHGVSQISQEPGQAQENLFPAKKNVPDPLISGREDSPPEPWDPRIFKPPPGECDELTSQAMGFEEDWDVSDYDNGPFMSFMAWCEDNEKEPGKPVSAIPDVVMKQEQSTQQKTSPDQGPKSPVEDDEDVQYIGIDPPTAQVSWEQLVLAAEQEVSTDPAEERTAGSPSSMPSLEPNTPEERVMTEDEPALVKSTAEPNVSSPGPVEGQETGNSVLASDVSAQELVQAVATLVQVNTNTSTSEPESTVIPNSTSDSTESFIYETSTGFLVYGAEPSQEADLEIWGYVLSKILVPPYDFQLYWERDNLNSEQTQTLCWIPPGMKKAENSIPLKIDTQTLARWTALQGPVSKPKNESRTLATSAQTYEVVKVQDFGTQAEALPELAENCTQANLIPLLMEAAVQTDLIETTSESDQASVNEEDENQLANQEVNEDNSQATFSEENSHNTQNLMCTLPLSGQCNLSSQSEIGETSQSERQEGLDSQDTNPEPESEGWDITGSSLPGGSSTEFPSECSNQVSTKEECSRKLMAVLCPQCHSAHWLSKDAIFRGTNRVLMSLIVCHCRHMFQFCTSKEGEKLLATYFQE